MQICKEESVSSFDFRFVNKKKKTYQISADVPAAVTERLREEQNQSDEQNDDRACGHVGGAGFERNECGHLYEHHYDRNLKECDRRRVNGCAYFARIIHIVDVVPVDKVLYRHEEKTCAGRKAVLVNMHSVR